MTMPFDRQLVCSAAESLRQARLRVSPVRDSRGRGWDPLREPMAEALATPAVSAGAVIAKLSAVGPILDQAGAGRVAAFNQLYLAISRRVQSALQTVATEPVYLELLAVELAKRYFAALDAWSGDGEDTPAVWTVLFGWADDPGPGRLTAAMVGVNAQLNHDLPLALLGVWGELGPPTDDQVHPDYRLLDQIYYDEIAPLRRGFSAEWERELDELAGPLDDWTGPALGTAVRAHSWAQAERLWPLRDDPADFGPARHAMDEAAALIAEWAIVGDRLVPGAGLESYDGEDDGEDGDGEDDDGEDDDGELRPGRTISGP